MEASVPRQDTLADRPRRIRQEDGPAFMFCPQPVPKAGSGWAAEVIVVVADASMPLLKHP